MKNRSYVNVVIGLIVLVALAGALSLVLKNIMPSKDPADLDACFNITAQDQVGVTVDGVTCEQTGLLRDGRTYLPLETVRSKVNEAVWYDEEEQLFCVTTPTLSETFSKEELMSSGDVLEEDQLYLSLDFIRQWSDIEVEYFESPARLMILKTWPYETIPVIKDTCLRLKGTTRSPYTAKVSAGDTLYLVSDNADQQELEGWYYVMTMNGIGGYVMSEDLGSRTDSGQDHVSAIGEYTSLALSGKVNMVFYQTNNSVMTNSLTDKLSNGVSGVNVISPTWFFLDGPGEVTSICNSAFVDTCHNADYQVWALLNDIDGACTDSGSVYEALKRTSDRRTLINKMMQEIETYKIDGLNIDLEHISEECAPVYREFIRELSVECRNRGLYLSVDMYVPMDYSLYLDRGSIGRVVDYVVVMCYDEHFKGSEEAGSVSSISYVENGIERTLREVPKEKVLAALPFYTRVWKIYGEGKPESELLSMWETSSYIAEHNMSTYWDTEVCQNVAEGEDGNAHLKIWVEDAASMTEKMKVVKEYDIAGTAAWRLGNETSDIWDVLKW